MSSSQLNRAQKFLDAATQRYQEACSTKGTVARRKIRETRRVMRSAQQQRDFIAIAQAKILLSYLGAIKVRPRGASTFDIFYGGIGKADGIGQGHVVIQGNRIVYKREPSLAHLPEGEEV